MRLVGMHLKIFTSIFVWMVHDAKHWKQAEDGMVQCLLCPHHCLIATGKYGKCRVRKNEDEALVSTVYGKICSYAFDPIEKKPLYHFYPGKEILSLGSVGCNMRCQFCQNNTISQTSAEDFPRLFNITPLEVVALAGSRVGNIGVAYTYNEPTVWFEFMMDTAKKVHDAGMLNAVVTNGFIEKEPLDELLRVTDAFSVDLKGFNEKFYQDMTASSLEPVKRSLRQIAESGRHLEIVNLIVPGKNDDIDTFREMIYFIKSDLEKDTVLHLSRYYPNYKFNKPPTPVKTMQELQKVAKESLTYVYLGNMPY